MLFSREEFCGKCWRYQSLNSIVKSNFEMPVTFPKSEWVKVNMNGKAQKRHCHITPLFMHWCSLFLVLTHCGLVTPYGYRDLGQHWLKQWLVAWRHQAITWINVDWSSVKSSDVQIRAISQEMSQPSIIEICLKITCLKFHSNFPGANELTHHINSLVQDYGISSLALTHQYTIHDID